MVSEWRPVFLSPQMLSAGGSQKPQAGLFAKRSFQGSLLELLKGYFAGADPLLYKTNAENDFEINQEAEERKLHRMAKVHDFLEMWRGRQNLCATQKESRAQNKQMTAVGYISDTEEIVKASWSPFSHDGAAAFKLSERSPLPPPLSARDLPGRRTQILNVRRI